MGIAILNATIFDCTGREPYGPGAVLIEAERIRAVGRMGQVSIPRDTQIVDVGGKTVMPGLIDAHTHLGNVENNFLASIEDQHPGAVYAYSVARNLEKCLELGFTTIRDAGGLDWSFKAAVQQGMVKGPRLLISNGYISQTGGHGDLRPRYDRSDPRPLHRLMPPHAVCDGEAEVRHAAREQLRTGADQLKVMAGGGAGSFTDPLDAPQFTVEEIAAAVHEARAVKKTVMAHVYVPEGIKNCVTAGVHSIEHANFLDEESAYLMKEHGTFLVPTLTVFELLTRSDQGLPEVTVQKANFAKSAAPQSVEIAMAAGVAIGSGSDIYGQHGHLRAWELELKAAVMGPVDSLLSATKTNAELLGIQNDVGTIEAGKLADIIVVDGNPVEDITLLRDDVKINLVMQSGLFVKQ